MDSGIEKPTCFPFASRSSHRGTYTRAPALTLSSSISRPNAGCTLRILWACHPIGSEPNMAWCCALQPGCSRISAIIFWVPGAPDHASRWARALGSELRQTLQGFVHFKPGCSSAPAEPRRISAIVFWVPEAPNHASRWARALGWELRQTLQGFVHVKPGCLSAPADLRRISAIIFWVPEAPDHAGRWARAG